MMTMENFLAFVLYGKKQWPNGARHVNFGMKIKYEHFHALYMEYYL
jgi:hypothetical protein